MDRVQPLSGGGHLGGPASPLGDLVCEACGTTFRTREAMRDHDARVHGVVHGQALPPKR